MAAEGLCREPEIVKSAPKKTCSPRPVPVGVLPTVPLVVIIEEDTAGLAADGLGGMSPGDATVPYDRYGGGWPNCGTMACSERWSMCRNSSFEMWG